MAETFLLIIFAFLPGIIWLFFYYYKDLHREPTRPFLQMFFAGMALTLPVVFLEYCVEIFFPYSQDANPLVVYGGAFLGIALLEELAKCGLLRFSVYRNNVFDEPMDGIIYAVAIAVGFASVENVLAALSGGTELLVARSITATLLHLGATGLAGFCFGKAKFAKQYSIWWQLAGVVLAAAIHGAYNFIISQEFANLYLWLATFLIGLYLLLWFAIAIIQKQEVTK